eukprot:1167985-Rhodomonas_salina.4
MGPNLENLSSGNVLLVYTVCQEFPTAMVAVTTRRLMRARNGGILVHLTTKLKLSAPVWTEEGAAGRRLARSEVFVCVVSDHRSSGVLAGA